MISCVQISDAFISWDKYSRHSLKKNICEVPTSFLQTCRFWPFTYLFSFEVPVRLLKRWFWLLSSVGFAVLSAGFPGRKKLQNKHLQNNQVLWDAKKNIRDRRERLCELYITRWECVLCNFLGTRNTMIIQMTRQDYYALCMLWPPCKRAIFSTQIMGDFQVLNYAVNTGETGENPLETMSKNPVETAAWNCGFLSLCMQVVSRCVLDLKAHFSGIFMLLRHYHGVRKCLPNSMSQTLQIIYR